MFDFLFSMFQKRGTSGGFSHGGGTGSLSDGLMCGRGCSVVLSRNIFLSFDHGANRKNADVVVIGGKDASSGIRNFVEPNIIMADHSYVVVDQGGVLYDKYKMYLMECGYDIIRIDASDRSLRIPLLDSIGDHKTAVFFVFSGRDEKTVFSVLERIYEDLCRYADGSARFSQMVVSEEGEVLKTFRASSEEESHQKEDEAGCFINSVGGCDAVFGKGPNHYNLVIRNNGMVLQKSAVPERDVLRSSHVERNSGACLPIHVGFFVPYFGKRPIRNSSLFAAPSGKRNISISVITGSVPESKKYEKVLERIAASAGAILFLGNTDRRTELWLEKKQDEKADGTGAAGCFSRYQSGTVYSADQLHDLAEDECVVIMTSAPVFKDKKAVPKNIAQRAEQKTVSPR